MMGCSHDFHKCEDLGHRPDGVPLPPTPPPAGRPKLEGIKELNPVYYQAEEQFRRHSAALGKDCACEPCKLFVALAAAERRVAEAESANRTLASNAYDAARENERRKEALETIVKLSGGVPSSALIHAMAGTAVAALAAETREPDTSHLVPIPGKPGGFTNKNYRRPGAEPREPEGEKP